MYNLPCKRDFKFNQLNKKIIKLSAFRQYFSADRRVNRHVVCPQQEQVSDRQRHTHSIYFHDSPFTSSCFVSFETSQQTFMSRCCGSTQVSRSSLYRPQRNVLSLHLPLPLSLHFCATTELSLSREAGHSWRPTLSEKASPWYSFRFCAFLWF